MLLFQDGFDLYGSATVADFGTQWDFVNSNIFVGSYITTGGRFNGRALRATGGIDALLAKRIVSSDKPFASMAIMQTALPSVNDRLLIGFQPVFSPTPEDVGGILTANHVSCRITTEGKIQILVGATVVATSTAQAIFANQWHRVEMSCVIDDAVGTAEVRVDGASVVDFTGDTQNTGAHASKLTIDSVIFSSSNATTHIDDIKIWNDESDTPNDWLGDFVITTLLPTANGSTVTSTPSTGAANTCVDETGIGNGDTDYVSNAATGVDLFTMANPTLGGDVYGVAVKPMMRADAPGLRKVRPGVRLSGTNYFAGADMVVPAQSAYRRISTFLGLNPGTSAPWEISELTGLEAGYNITG